MRGRQVIGGLAGLLVVSAFGAVSAQEGAGASGTKTKLSALPMGQAAQGSVKSEQGASYAFKAETAGVLTVAVRGEGDADLVLLVTDEDGQTVQSGRADQDLGSAKGAEQLAVTIPYPGDYIVRVDLSSGEAKFAIGAAWIAMPQAARAPDPDGRPRSATPLEVGKSKSDTLDVTGGDLWDWYAVQITSPGTLTVLTKAPEGDLVLEAFHDGNFRDSFEHSDNDMNEVKGNESISIHVDAGQTIFFRISSLFSGQIPYKVSSGLIPD